jgi:hypothetical protein
MTANLSIRDTPPAYTPPAGPAVRFTFRYNSRDSYATEQIPGGYYWNGLRDGAQLHLAPYGHGCRLTSVSNMIHPPCK